MRRLANAVGPWVDELRARRLRVALVVSSLGGGGAERVASELAAHWDRSGHRVIVVTVWSRELDAYPLPTSVDRVALDLGRDSRHLLEGLVRGAWRVGALRRALRRARPDVVVSLLVSTNVLSLLAMLGTRVPVFVCERTEPRRERIGRPWAALRRLLYPRAAGVVVQTETVAIWARAFCRRVHVIPNFVERPLRMACPDADSGPRQLVAMGRLVPEKGFDVLIEAFAKLAELHPDWSLRILGEGPERGRLEALVREHRLQDRVSIPGRVADPFPELVASHAFALPSRREGFPNALLEAMACGLPAVAFDCPSGPGEIIVHGHNGLLVRDGDVTHLAAALDGLMRSAMERRRLGQNAREISVSLAPDRILERWDALLRRAGA